MNLRIDRAWICRNTANAVTVFGIFLCQVLKVVIYAYTECLGAIFCIASAIAVTDWIDGPIARHFERKGYAGSISDFGKAADRYRDKDCVITMLFFIIWHPAVDYHLKWAVWPLVVAEFVLLATVFVAVKKKKDASATDWGKWKMALECVVILAIVAIVLARAHKITVPQYVTYPVTFLALVAGFFAVMSAKNHIANFLCRSQPRAP